MIHSVYDEHTKNERLHKEENNDIVKEFEDKEESKNINDNETF